MLSFIRKHKDSIYKIVDIVICISLFFLAIRKGGFYKSDCLPINLIITLIGTIYVALKLYLDISDTKAKKSLDINYIFLFLLSICYLLPIIFNNYSSYSDSLYEFIRYLDILLLYVIVKKSSNKNLYLKLIIFIGIVECILGIDQLANRYLDNLLEIFNSGYLSNTLDRMSATIQYANTFAIIICVCIIILIKQIDSILYSKNNLNIAFKIVLLNMFFTCLILTKTRFALLSLLIGIILLFKLDISNKFKTFIIIVENLILALILSNNIINQIAGQTINIYYLFFGSYVIYFIIVYILLKIFNKKFLCNKFLYNKLLIHKKHIIFITCIAIILYIVLALTLTKGVNLDNYKNKYTAYFYNNIKKDSNIIDLEIDTKDVTSVYRIDIFKITNDNNIELFESATQENNIDGKITVDLSRFNMKDCKKIKIDFVLESGNIQINKVYINNKSYAISYYLIPYEFVSKINDSIHGADSMTSRFTYLNDAFKIITSSKKSFFVGNGGEAFRNMYNQFKSTNYTSTEVHNSYVQIFCEAGIFGFILIIITLVYNLLKAKKDYKFVALFVLLLHSIQDLNFSYMIVLMILSILISELEYKTGNLVLLVNKKIICITLCFSLFIGGVTTFILLKANMASKMYIQDIEYDDNLTQDIVEKNLELYSKRAKLDSTDSNYIIKLIDKKVEYIQFLKSKQGENIANEININLKEIEHLTSSMINNDKYNKTVLLNACNIYIANMDSFIKLNFNDNYEDGKKYYSRLVSDILDDIYKYYHLNESVIKTVKQYKEMLDYK